MEQRDRDTINRVCDAIVPMIDISTLWPRLIEYGVYDDDDMDVPKWETDLSNPNTVRDILLTIKTRGPRAFNNLVRGLYTTNQHAAADILRGSPVPRSKDNRLDKTNNDEWMEEFYDNFENSEQPIQIKVIKATEFLDNPDYNTLPKYRMRSKPRGYVLIITIISYFNEPKRNAAEHDEMNLKKLFEDMGFEVTTKMDLTASQIREAVKEFSLRDFRKVDSSFVIISAHGRDMDNSGASGTEIQGVDYNMPGAEKISTMDIINYFAADHCNKHLNGKPKVFIFQACRGKKHQKNTPRHETDGSRSNEEVRTFADILIAHATIPGHVAYRDRYVGSWFIQTLCSVFMQYANRLHLVDLFGMVDGVMKKLRTQDNSSQTPLIQLMGFGKHCYLNPGIYEEP